MRACVAHDWCSAAAVATAAESLHHMTTVSNTLTLTLGISGASRLPVALSRMRQARLAAGLACCL